MLALITGMLLCVGLAVSVVWVVAVPARREGRELFLHSSRGTEAEPGPAPADPQASVEAARGPVSSRVAEDTTAG